MIYDVSNAILWRKYYFSLPVERLFHHLLHREVPLIPGLKDNIYNLYEQLDRANDRNSDWAFSTHLVLKFITVIKCSTKRHTSPEKRIPALCQHHYNHEYTVFEYLNGEVITRIYEQHIIDNLRLFFKYAHYKSLGDYLLFELRRGTNIKQNHFLLGLADSISFDNWMMSKAVRGELINVV